MNATACYFVTGMENENAEIARGLRRRDADLLDRLIEQYQHRLLRFHEGLALEEIATVTGAKLGTVKSRLYRGLNMLMSRLERAQA